MDISQFHREIIASIADFAVKPTIQTTIQIELVLFRGILARLLDPLDDS
jgi:hypothetical protein